MARQSRKTPTTPEARPVVKRAAASGSPEGFQVPENAHRFGLKEYVLVNVLFDIFCVLQLLFIRTTLKESKGLYFFFGLLMIGFLIVSVYDYFYDRLVPEDETV